MSKIFVSGLPGNISEAALVDYFSRFGKIDHREFGQTRNMAYVTFTKPAAADACLAQSNNHSLNGKWLEVKRASRNPEGGGKGQGKSKKSSGKGSRGKDTGNNTDNSHSNNDSHNNNTTTTSTQPEATTNNTTKTAPPSTKASTTTATATEKELMSMGFSHRQVKRVLPSCGWDLNVALDRLIKEGPEKTPILTENISTASGSIEDDEDDRSQKWKGKGGKGSTTNNNNTTTTATVSATVPTTTIAETNAESSANATENGTSGGAWGGKGRKPTAAVEVKVESPVKNKAVSPVAGEGNGASLSGWDSLMAGQPSGTAATTTENSVAAAIQSQQTPAPAPAPAPTAAAAAAPQQAQPAPQPQQQQIHHHQQQQQPAAAVAPMQTAQAAAMPGQLYGYYATPQPAPAFVDYSQAAAYQGYFPQAQYFPQLAQQPQQAQQQPVQQQAAQQQAQQQQQQAQQQAQQQQQQAQQQQAQQQQQQPQQQQQQGAAPAQQQQQPSDEKVIVSPCQAYVPDPSYQGGNSEFLKLDEDLQQQIEVLLYDASNSGWSFGRDCRDKRQGWFPTNCVQFDVVKAMYSFDTSPEETRQYISFTQGQKVVVQKRHECGWWVGSVIENQEHGNLGPRGYFPGNYCQEL